MATTVAQLLATLGLDASDFNKGIDKAEDKGSSFNKTMKGMATIGGGVLAAGFATAAAGAVIFGKELYTDIQLAVDAEKVQAQLNAVLKSTGGIAGVTAEKANELANSLSSVTMFDDEAVLSGENLLLTFTNIGSDVFPEATEAMLDMSQALGQDLQSSAIQLGKALNDPVQGITALQRVGVSFTDEQKEMVKGMVESGNVMEAQRFILAELQKEFGGSAKAAGETFGGQVTILKNKIDNMRESIGAKLLPELLKLANMLNDYLSKPETQAMIQKLADTFAQWAAQAIQYLPVMIEGFVGLFSWLLEHKGVIVAAVSVIGTVIVAFLASIAVTAWAAIAPFLPIIAIIVLVGLAIYSLYIGWKKNFELIGKVIDWLKGYWTALWNTILSVLDFFMPGISVKIKNMIENIKNFFKNVNWSEVGMNILKGIVAGMNNLENWVTSQIRKLGQKIVNSFTSFFGIHSRSQLMYDLIGKNMALGLNMGYEETLQLEPSKALENFSLGSISGNVSRNTKEDQPPPKIELDEQRLAFLFAKELAKVIR